MRKQLSDTVEDYLKMIYKLSADIERVGTGQIAEALEVSPASVTDMFHFSVLPMKIPRCLTISNTRE